MPPVTKAGGQQFQKDVEFVAKDDDEQIAAGIVMVPDKADLQHDFVREDTIREFASQFQTFVEEELASGGIMHAVWPDGWMELERNEVLDEAEEIGGQEVQAGAWVQEWGINDDGLWGLITDGILEGYSIGARDVDWNGPHEQDEVDDVEVPDDLPDDALIWELVSGIIWEVSAVDIPAVPDAEILEAKALQKRLANHLGDRDAFIDEAMQRGHTDAEAERLWDELNRAIEVEGSGEPGKQSMFARAGKAFFSAFFGSDDDTPITAASEAPDREKDDEEAFEADVFRITAPEDEADRYEDSVLGIGVDFPNSGVYVDWRNEVFPDQLDEPHVSVYGSISDLEQATGNDVEQLDTLNAKAAKSLFGPTGVRIDLADKEGRTLSTANEHSLKAIIDSAVDTLEDAGVDHGITRFTDREDDSFDLSEHEARVWPDSGEDEGDDVSPLDNSADNGSDGDDDGDDDDGDDEDSESATNDAPDGDTSESGSTDAADDADTDTTMSDNDSGGEDGDKSLAEKNAEQIENNAEQLGDLTAAVEGLTEALAGSGEEKTAEIEVDGEVYEVTESEAKSWFEDDDGDADKGSDSDDPISSLKDTVETLESRLDTISEQSGVSGKSTQIRDANNNDSEPDSGLDALGKALS